MAMIEVKNVSKSYNVKRRDEATDKHVRGKLQVLNNFSVNFDQEGVTVLLGPSGTGKSTLLRCINGLETIDDGDIIVDGMSVREKRMLRKIRLTCGMVFQQTVLFPHLDVMQNLTMSPVKLLHMDKKEAEEKARFYLDKVGLSSKEKAKHNELSGGEQQRIAIARAMLKNAPILILDEATAFADPDNETKVQAAFTELSRGKTVLLIAHRLTTVTHADRICVVQDGRIAESGTSRELLEKGGIFRRMWDNYQTSVQWKVAKEA